MTFGRAHQNVTEVHLNHLGNLTMQPTPTPAPPQQSLHPFEYQAPTDEQTARIKAMRQSFKDLHDQICNLIPASRERSVAITQLEQASMWVNKAVVFNGGRPEPQP